MWLLPFQEGSSHERGLYFRSFEELFDLSNSDTTTTSQYTFYVTAFELYNEQVFQSFQFYTFFICFDTINIVISLVYHINQCFSYSAYFSLL